MKTQIALIALAMTLTPLTAKSQSYDLNQPVNIYQNRDARQSHNHDEIQKACDNLYQMQMMGMNTGAIVQGIMFTGTEKAKRELLAMRRVCPDALQHTTPRF